MNRATVRWVCILQSIAMLLLCGLMSQYEPANIKVVAFYGFASIQFAIFALIAKDNHEH